MTCVYIYPIVCYMKLQSGCSGCFAGLSCSTRIEIINFLQEKKKLSVSELAKHFQVSQPTITHHLQYLKEAGALDYQKVGRKVYYFLDPKCGFSECEVFK